VRVPIKSNVLVVSYDSGSYGHCPAIWANDKIHAIVGLERSVTLVTSPASDLVSGGNVRVIKVPSISLRDFRFEYATARSNSRASLLLTLFWPVALILGSVFDLAFKLIAGSLSDGRYSWALLATPVLVSLRITNPTAQVFATGGASSGPVSAVMASLFSKRKPVVEFQDPFIGKMMQLSPRASRAMLWLERFIVRHCKKVVFVTRQAAMDAQARNKSLSRRIEHIYPGSRTFAPHDLSAEESKFGTGLIEIFHMGTLYGSRNLDFCFKALDSLYFRRLDLKGKVLVSNMGSVHLATLPEYLLREDFQDLKRRPREAAVQRAALADILLLVQHTDERSAETIPYKTYDYLNLDKPVLALGNSPELRQLVEQTGGFFAQNSDVRAIEDALEKAIDMSLSDVPIRSVGPRINLSEQISLALNI